MPTATKPRPKGKAAKKQKRMTVTDELRLIAKMHGGILRPRDVVAFAKNPKTALHGDFDWSDASAAMKHRIQQAEQIIRARFTFLPSKEGPGEKVRVREYGSLSSERGKGGVYRFMADIMKVPSQKAQMLEDAKNELRAFQHKYSAITELKGIRAAIGRLID